MIDFLQLKSSNQGQIYRRKNNQRIKIVKKNLKKLKSKNFALDLARGAGQKWSFFSY